MDTRFEHTTYFVRKKALQLFGGTFWVYDPSGGLAFYSKQKKFKLKEDIRLYTGEDMTTEVLTIKARQVIDFSAAYDIIDPARGEKVGAMKRKGFKSLVKDEWIFMDPYDRDIGAVREDSTGLAIVRRVINNWIPSSILLPQSYHCDIGGAAVAAFHQNFNPFIMKLTLDFAPDTGGLLDRRLGLAAGILLCAIEGKQ
jgi:hypothetical protein